MSNLVDLTGRDFGRLNVLRRGPDQPPTAGHRSARVTWVCLCACGIERAVSAELLRSGNTRSCGCLHAESMEAIFVKHGCGRTGSRRTPEYRAWQNILRRCGNPNNPGFKYYGGRGITVCEEWRESFENFLSDMGERPSKKHSIDRIDNNSGYRKSNCRWATKIQQSANRRNTIRLTFGGESRTVREWSEICGIPQATLRVRIKLGWDAGRVVSSPVNEKRRQSI